MPAVLIRTSMRPYFSAMAAITSRTWGSLVTSSWKMSQERPSAARSACTRWALARVVLVRRSLAPLAAMQRPMAAPRPPAPTTRTTFPSREKRSLTLQLVTISLIAIALFSH